MSNNWQNVDFANLPMPDTFLIDYVRVWQRPGYGSIGCDPASHPTKDYIESHPEAYQNQNNTLWADAGYEWPVSLQVALRSGFHEPGDMMYLELTW
jgi:hypothetical protein